MRRRWCLIGLALLGASCTTPPPRIPFDSSEGFHALVVGSKRWTSDRFHPEYETLGIQFITDAPGTSGWGWELGGRYASDTGNGLRRIRILPPQTTNPTAAVPTERSSDYYELSVGVRQTFREDSPVQPYFGVGTVLVKIKNVDRLDLSTLPLGHGNSSVEHYEEIGLALYLRAGLRWNILRDQFRESTEAVVTLDVRGLYGEEFNFVELTLGLGFGR